MCGTARPAKAASYVSVCSGNRVCRMHEHCTDFQTEAAKSGSRLFALPVKHPPV